MKTDTQIQDDVQAEIAWDTSIEGSRISVAVSNGIVTLSGHVATYAEKFEAERAAQRVAGVQALAVELTVAPSGVYDRTDTDVARAAETALQYLVFLRTDAVKLLVEDGWITLSGTLEWQHQRRIVLAALRYLSGVRGITDHLTIVSRPPSVTIQRDIEAALRRRVDADSQRISVAVNAGEVTLSGTVTSWWQKELAREAAWNSGGVTFVHNELKVAA